MKKFSVMAGMLLIVGLFTACSSNNNENNLEDELPELNVDFDVPETADSKENVHLEALVTYDGEPVEEADEVLFEIWESGNEDDSEKIEADNEGEGVYTLDYQFDEDGVYEMYAHTTAEGLHTMPKKQIAVGDAEIPDDEDDEDENNEHGEHNM
ncbi:MAG TPA: FixH family protein [Pseudogracilibacillus sp.]|nr:FixH family protein [Pseudogracilibacillus sp.]